ncbi:MAG: Gfo/Idh/MocA family oxidoreductase [Verrucomicrobia bacterium]|nr:Gfo/Idh/MocA family oxidoreductase [Verrucomicrobiota bacterium]MBU4290740.1 Gfo/Idh/MocA family oxidoreductase [Verrucomicrobiota bacterium]MBU4428673.1 Gfo/Idh/MocA family oxidoreductase [Verrucomicrobiota bacterium]MCG2679758.1 Gfo/Idh/MocA family oxidoreductase [Kiritimatiellia bacterium]
MINVGFIGTGGICAVHLNYLKTRKDVRIAALCDIHSNAVAKRQKEYGGLAFTDFRKMLNQVRLDAVWICTPPLVRKDPLLACADRNIPVFCEKPVEHDKSRGKAIATALARRKAKVQIGYVFRCLPIVNALRQAMKDDTIHLIHSFYGCNVSLTMGLPAWFYDKSKSGGALVDQATHNLDLLRFLFGEVRNIHGLAANPVHKKAGHYTIDETLGLLFRFRNGIIATHNHTWVGNGWRNEIVISGEKHIYRINLGNGSLIVDGPPSKKAKPATKTTLVPNASAADQVWFQHDGSSIYRYENEYFLRQVVSGNWSRNPSDYADGLKTLQLTLACDRAITQGKATVAS